MKHKKFFKNAVILTATSIILRTVGIFFRIWVSGAIGPEGMGLYQLIISVYAFAATFAAAGISTAVTRLISELPEVGGSAKKIMHRAVTLTLILAFITMVTVYFGAEPISRYMLCDMRAVPAIRILVFGLPFMGISACIRGYFLALRNTSFSSISQLLEQAVRIALIIWLLGRVSNFGLAAACGAILVGDTIAEGAGCIFLWIAYKFSKKNNPSGNKFQPAVTRKMLHIALPITLGRYIHTALRTAENLLVPARIAIFSKSREVALSQFGMLKGMAMPLLFFPASFLNAFSTLMIPEISEALSRGHLYKVRMQVQKAIGVTVIVSTLIGGMFFICGNDLARLLYGSAETGVLITTLSPLVPFMYLESVCDGILKGLDQQGHSFIYSVIDSVSRILLIMLFLDDFGMQGFLLIMVYSNLLTSLLNIRRLLKVTETPLDFKGWIVLPIVFIAASCCLGYMALSTAVSPALRVGIGCGTTAVIYLCLMFISGQLNILDGIF